MALQPGKGAHMVLNQSVLDFVEASLDMISSVYSDEDHDNNPKAVLDALLAYEVVEGDVAWQEEKDSFGHKAYRTMPYKKGALRVTVVLTKQDELRLDIREWYSPDQA